MRGENVLRACMLGLVLVDLVFVQLTGAAGLAWLLPLYALTLFSPLWARLRERRLYRLAWNAGVLAVFGVLVRHASGYDLRFVLQDGLVLAALCQVHLLNNLRTGQRPDLLFWNAFLIAVATGYLSQDLEYLFAFLAYVPLYVVGLQLLCVTRRCAKLEPGPTRRVVRDGLARSAVLLAATFVVFLFWPRDFHRPSWLAGELDFDPGAGPLEIGFRARLEPGRGERAKASDRVVMQVTLERGAPADVPELWRGATLASTDGEAWWPLPPAPFERRETGDARWQRRGGELVRGGGGTGAVAVVSVELVEHEGDALFAPLSAERFRAGGDMDPGHLTAGTDATLRHVGDSGRAPLLYELALGPEDAAQRWGCAPRELDPGLAPFVDLPRAPGVRAAGELADALAARLPADAPQHELVSLFTRHLEARYAYFAPGADGGADDLDELLRGGAGGHCELFAAALATMLRCRGVPCRVVTGYRSREWDAGRRALTVRRRHAHAWVEVFDPTAGWYAADPSPASSAARSPGPWDRIHAFLGRRWAALAGFDAASREALLSWVRGLPARAGALPSGLAALGVAMLLALRAARRRRTAPGVRRYERAVRRAGLRLARGETPRELLGRARRDGVDAARLASLRAATREHERARYSA